MDELLLLPRPRRMERLPGAGPGPDAPVEARVDPALPAEGFVLRLGEDKVRIRHRDASGRRYAEETWRQIRSQRPGGAPALRIEDAPDLPVRGVMLDVSRDRVPTRATLERLVALMATLRLNHLELYTEHTFAYREHEEVWRDASPITPDDVRWLDALCASVGIELVPNQNTFGHMGRWLAHPAYRARAEAPQGFRTRFGLELPPSVLAPTEENARFAVGLCRELLACHRSRRIHIGCDETFELGQGASRAAVEQLGKGRVYLEHLLRIARPLLADGCQVLYWGDILRSHPQLVRELPREGLVALAWHYEAPGDPDRLPPAIYELAAEFGITREAMAGFGGHVRAFADAGVPFWVCPGTSSWNSLVGRWGNARANILDAVETGVAAGAGGLLLTDWGDNGHLQPPSVSFPPLVYAAALGWCRSANESLDVAAALDAFVFEDAAGGMGGALTALGEAYAGTGRTGFNESPLFSALLKRALSLGSLGETDVAATRRTLEELEAARETLLEARPACTDAAQLQRELDVAARLARHGAWRMLRDAGAAAPDPATLARDLRAAIADQREAWLGRARPGGLADSLARLEAVLPDYSA